MSVLVTTSVLSPQPDGPPTLRTLEIVELSRVPCRGEHVRLGGTHYTVVGVTHVVAGGTAGEVVLEALPVLAAVEAQP